MNNSSTTRFAPKLIIPRGTLSVDFYVSGLGAVELRKWMNDDGSIHVVELELDGAMFHLHEENLDKETFNPAKNNGVTATIGVFVKNVDDMMQRAITAGASQTSPAQDYDYGYRQGEIKDPFGHLWTFQMPLQIRRPESTNFF